MGQPIEVAEQPSRSNRGVVRFETNRALTGMGHERYPTRESATGVRPPDELARRLFDRGGVAGIHINGNVITVDLERGYTSEGMREIIEDLYRFYHEPTGEEQAADAPAADAPAADVPVEEPAET
jgi:hypothetical protein